MGAKIQISLHYQISTPIPPLFIKSLGLYHLLNLEMTLVYRYEKKSLAFYKVGRVDWAFLVACIGNGITATLLGVAGQDCFRGLF